MARTRRKLLGGAISAEVCVAITMLAVATPYSPASAHQTQISDGVGGTHHIEPNDTPQAGEPSQAWFALTQAGGTAIGLSDCDCELVVAVAGGEAIATPPLTAIAVEGLTDVPAAELTFPQVGAYVLTLTGSPKGAADFPDFRLDFPITVAGGKAIAQKAGPETLPETVPDAAKSGESAGEEESLAQPGPADTNAKVSARWGWMGLMAGGVALATAAFVLVRRKS